METVASTSNNVAHLSEHKPVSGGNGVSNAGWNFHSPISSSPSVSHAVFFALTGEPQEKLLFTPQRSSAAIIPRYATSPARHAAPEAQVDSGSSTTVGTTAATKSFCLVATRRGAGRFRRIRVVMAC